MTDVQFPNQAAPRHSAFAEDLIECDKMGMMKGKIMARIHVACLVSFMMLVAMAGTADSVDRDPGYDKVREQMADLLASDQLDKVDFSAQTYDLAMAWIYRAVDTYLEGSAEALGGIEDAGEFGFEVLQGLNKHKVRYMDDDGYDLVGDRDLVVSNEQDAVEMGELIGIVAVMIHDAHAGRGVGIQIAAKRIFEGLFATPGTGQSVIGQYLVQLQDLSETEKRALIEYALE